MKDILEGIEAGLLDSAPLSVSYSDLHPFWGGSQLTTRYQDRQTSIWESPARETLHLSFPAWLVDHEQSHGIGALLQFAERVQSRVTRFRPQNAVSIGGAFSKIALNGAEHFGVVIYDQQCWFRHFDTRIH